MFVSIRWVVRAFAALAIAVLLTRQGRSFAAAEIGGEAAEFAEPVLTEETLPNEPGEHDLRLLARYEREGSEGTALLPWAEYFFGIAPRLGGEAGTGWVYHDSAERSHGLGPASLALKYVAVPHEGRVPAVVVGLEAGFPTGDGAESGGERSYEYTPFVALLQNFGSVVVQGNFGYAFEIPKGEGERSRAVEYSWAASAPVGEGRTHLFAELFGRIGADGVRDPLAVAPGVRFQPRAQWSVALAAIAGLTSSDPDWGASGQVQFSF